MSNNVSNDHVDEKHRYNNRMQWKGKQHNRKYQSLNYCFPWMKCIGCPRGGISRFMMNTMYIFIYAFEVHEPMGPIKIEVVEYYCYRKADEQVKQTVLVNIVVNVCIPCFDRQVNTKSDQRKYHHCAHRIGKLSYQVFTLWK